jgi:hypothetical protein
MILLLNFAATLFLTGLAWSMQFVQLPILRADQLAEHRRRNTWLMIVPMTIEGVSAFWLAIEPGVLLRIALMIWILLLTATILYSRASRRADLARLRRWNGIRVAFWSARTVLVGLILLQSRHAW